MVRKDKEVVRSSTSAVFVRPRYQLGEKHHQIRAYILLIQVTEVRHLVRRFFPTTHVYYMMSSSDFNHCLTAARGHFSVACSLISVLIFGDVWVSGL